MHSKIIKSVLSVLCLMLFGIIAYDTSTLVQADDNNFQNTSIPGLNNQVDGVLLWNPSSGSQLGSNAFRMDSSTATSSNIVSLNSDFALGLWVYRPSGAAVPQFSLKNSSGDNVIQNVTTGDDATIPLNVGTGSWTHVSIYYLATYHRLYATFGDRDINNHKRATAEATSEPTNYGVGSATGTNFAFSISNNSSVAIDANTQFLNTSASAKLTDLTTNKLVTDGTATAASQNWTDKSSLSTSKNVYGGDKLQLVYQLKLKSDSSLLNVVIGLRLQLHQISNVSWDSAVAIHVWNGAVGSGTSTDTSTTLAELLKTGDNDSTTNAAFPQTILADVKKGQTIQVVLTGKAADVDTDTKVSATDFQFLNGGGDAYLYDKSFTLDKVNAATWFNGKQDDIQTPTFTILPAIKATPSVTVKDTSITSNTAQTPLSKNSLVMRGDTLKYTYQLHLDSDSHFDWANIKASLPTPSGFTASGYKVTYADGTSSDSWENGDTLNTLTQKNNNVTITVTGKVNADATAVSTVTGKFASTSPYSHDESIATPALKVYVPDKATDSPTWNQFGSSPNAISLGTGTFDNSGINWTTREDATGFTIYGGVHDANGKTDGLNNADILYIVTVGDQTYKVRFPNDSANNGLYRFRILKPDQPFTPVTTTTLDSDINGGQREITIGRLPAGTDPTTITIQTVYKDGTTALYANSGTKQAKRTITVTPGTLTMTVGDLNFNGIANGQAQTWAPENPVLTVSNTARVNWNLQVSMTKAITNVDDPTDRFGGDLFLGNGKGVSYSISSDGVSSAQVGNGSPIVNSDSASTDLTKGWQASNELLQAGTAKGIFLSVLPNAKQGTYQGELTWTLTSDPTNAQ